MVEHCPKNPRKREKTKQKTNKQTKKPSTTACQVTGTVSGSGLCCCVPCYTRKVCRALWIKSLCLLILKRMSLLPLGSQPAEGSRGREFSEGRTQTRRICWRILLLKFR